MTQEIARTEVDNWELPEPVQVETGLKAVRAFQKLVHSLMVEGHDYGKIPGTPRPTLLKPGAEKIAKLLRLADYYEIVSETEDWEKGFFAYKVRCLLRSIGTDQVISTGLGECNSMESKYRWRWVYESELQRQGMKTEGLPTRWIPTRSGKRTPQYRVENEDIYSQVNTILKLAKKRALVDAALSAGRLSDIFTQDLEEVDRPATETTEEESLGEASQRPPEAPKQTETAPKTAATPAGAPVASQTYLEPPPGGTEHWPDLWNWALRISRAYTKAMVRQILGITDEAQWKGTLEEAKEKVWNFHISKT